MHLDHCKDGDLTLPYLTVPYALPYLMPYLTLCLTLPYLALPYLALPDSLPYLIAYLSLPLILPYLTLWLTLQEIQPHQLQYLLGVCFLSIQHVGLFVSDTAHKRFGGNQAVYEQSTKSFLHKVKLHWPRG